MNECIFLVKKNIIFILYNECIFLVKGDIIMVKPMLTHVCYFTVRMRTIGAGVVSRSLTGEGNFSAHASVIGDVY